MDLDGHAPLLSSNSEHNAFISGNAIRVDIIISGDTRMCDVTNGFGAVGLSIGLSAMINGNLGNDRMGNWRTVQRVTLMISPSTNSPH